MNAESEMNASDGLGSRPPAEPGECVAVCAACGGDVVVPKAAGVPPRVEHKDDCPREGWTAQDASRYDDGGHATRYNWQPPAVVVDPLADLAREVGYSDGIDATATGRVGDGTLDALIDYKNALEDRCRRVEGEQDRAEAALTQCQHIAHDGLVEIEQGTTWFLRWHKARELLEKINSIAEGGVADPEFVAMLAAADRD